MTSRQETVELVDLLLECHERIRRFVGAARAIGERADIPEPEVVESCLRIERYFSEGFPLHVADEEESVLPRLRGASPAVRNALTAMREEHEAHRPGLNALLDAVDAVRTGPSDPAARAALAEAATEMEAAFEAHLAMEEGLIFPAVQALDAQTQAEILGELRARRRGPVDISAERVRAYRSVS